MTIVKNNLYFTYLDQFGDKVIWWLIEMQQQVLWRCKYRYSRTQYSRFRPFAIRFLFQNLSILLFFPQKLKSFKNLTNICKTNDFLSNIWNISSLFRLLFNFEFKGSVFAVDWENVSTANSEARLYCFEYRQQLIRTNYIIRDPKLR